MLSYRGNYFQKWILLLINILLFVDSQQFCKEKTEKSNPIQLVCPSGANHTQKFENGKLYAMTESHNFRKACPEIYDYKGNLRVGKHMCLSSIQESICKFELNNVIVTSKGGLIDCSTAKPYSFDHESIGNMPPIYSAQVHSSWYNYYTDSKTLHINKKYNQNKYNLVVPTRLIWDDCWNHLSFTGMVLIGHVYEFYHDVWDEITWHASLFTAGLLTLMNIPKERIIIEKEIFAKKIILPWVRGWCPVQTASFQGVGKRVSAIMAKNLLALDKTSSNTSIINDKAFRKFRSTSINT